MPQDMSILAVLALVLLFLSHRIQPSESLSLSRGQEVYMFPVETATGQESFTQTVTFDTGLGDPGVSQLTSGKTVYVLQEAGTTFQLATQSIPSFLFQYYPSCLSEKFYQLEDLFHPGSEGHIDALFPTLSQVFSSFSSMSNTASTYNQPNTPPCATYQNSLGISYCSQLPFSQPASSSFAPSAAGGDIPGTECTSFYNNGAPLAYVYDGSNGDAYVSTGQCCLPSSCASFVWANDAGQPTADNWQTFGDNLDDSGDPGCLAAGSSTFQYCTGYWQGDFVGLFSPVQAEVNLTWFTPYASFPLFAQSNESVVSGNNLGIPGYFMKSAWECQVDPVIASNGVLEPGPSVPLWQICQMFDNSSYVSVTYPDYQPGTVFKSAEFDSAVDFCSQLSMYISPIPPAGSAVSVNLPFMALANMGPATMSSTPQIYVADYTFSTEELTVTFTDSLGLNRTDSFPLSEVIGDGPSVLQPVGQDISLWMPQQEGYYLFALQAAGKARRRRGCYCALLCFGLGGCGGGDVSGLNRLRDQVVKLADTVGQMENGVSLFEQHTSRYMSAMSQQLVTFINDQEVTDEKIWSAISDLQSSLEDVNQAEILLQQAAIHYTAEVDATARRNSLTLAQVKEQYGYRLAQLAITVAVLRDSLSLSAVRSMQGGALSSAENYCGSAFPMPLFLSNYLSTAGLVTSPQFNLEDPNVASMSDMLGFGLNPQFSPITAFPGTLASPSCFVTLLNDSAISVTWSVSTYDSSEIKYAYENGLSVGTIPSPQATRYGFPSVFRAVAYLDVFYADNQVPLGNQCGLLSTRVTPFHVYLDLYDGTIYGSMDPIDKFYMDGKGTPLLVNMSKDFFAEVFSRSDNTYQADTAPFPLAYDDVYPTGMSTDLRVVFADLSSMLSSSKQCVNSRYIVYGQNSGQQYLFGSASLGNRIRTLSPTRQHSLITSVTGVTPLSGSSPWSMDLVDAYVSGNSMADTALVKSAVGEALYANSALNSSSLALSSALQEQAILLNQTIARVSEQDMDSAAFLTNLTGLVLGFGELSSVISDHDSALTNNEAILQTLSDTSASNTAVLNDSKNRIISLEASSEALAQNMSMISSSISQLTSSYENSSQSDIEAANSFSASLFSQAQAISHDTFSTKSSACSGFDDIGCMIATFVKYILMMVAFALAVWIGIILFKKVMASRNKVTPNPEKTAPE